MTRILFVAFVLFSWISVNAQVAGLTVEGTSPSLHVLHTVQPKETLYSLGRIYNLSPAVIASFNGSNLQTGLKIGQVVKVPLTEQNFDQSGNAPGGETLVPVYHVVGGGETLFRIGNNYNKLPLTTVKQWNNLASDNVPAGKALIVGYLKAKNEQLANLKTSTPANAAASTSTVNKPAEVATPKTNVDEPPTTEPLIPAKSEPVVPKTEEPKKVEPTPSADKSVEKTDTILTKVEPVATRVNVEKTVGAATNRPAANIEEGFFATSFADNFEEKKLAELTGDAGTFKSTSGWQNKKYYALVNNIPSGTIVKITTGDKSVYAKVLGALPDMKENSSLTLRLSNAAASYLGIVDPKFPVKITYYQ